MPMPSLFKYFAFVGAALLGLLTLTNFLLDPSTGATVVSQQAPQAKPTATVQHDPRASKIERWRNEQAALRSTEPATTTAAKSVSQASAQPQPTPAVLTVPAQSAPAQAAAAPTAAIQSSATQAAVTQPAATPVALPVAAPVLQTTDASAIVASDTEDAAAEAARLKAEKAKAAQARKAAKLARDRARAEQQARSTGQFYAAPQQRSASNQQDAYYYGQRAPQQHQSYNAYAPRPSYGPFGWGNQGW
jgi:hypothetical protein